MGLQLLRLTQSDKIDKNVLVLEWKNRFSISY